MVLWSRYHLVGGSAVKKCHATVTLLTLTRELRQQVKGYIVVDRIMQIRVSRSAVEHL